MSHKSLNDKFKSYFDDIINDTNDNEIIKQLPYCNKFFCPNCVKLCIYKKASEHHIECVNCGDLKVYYKTYLPSQNLPFIHVGPSVKHRKFNYDKCVSCGLQEAEFNNLTFATTILGPVIDCVDMRQPMCFNCHLEYCNSSSHNICKNGLSKL